MPLIAGTDAPIFALDGLTVVGLASPTRGATETSAWRLTLAPGAPGAPHTVDREELFVALAGRAEATLADQRLAVAAGDALIVPAGTEFALANPHAEPFEAVAVCPVGSRAAFPGGPPFVPPWAE